MPNIVYYYQTFVGLDDIACDPTKVTTINLSSIHFGYTNDGTPYIHLNDSDPSTFCALWDKCRLLKNKGINFTLMLGGAGGAYTELFNNFSTFYPMLRKFIDSMRDIFTGIDIDIEETVQINTVIELIKCIKRDFGDNFIISMAPTAYELMYDQPGMAGIIYKDLYKQIGDLITFFHVQAYGNYTFSTFDSIVKNGYPQSKLIFGMASDNFTKDTFHKAIDTVKQIKTTYSDFGGVYDWEFFDAPPNPNHPIEWAVEMSNVINSDVIQ